jgi:hypothetical protein
MIFFAMIEFLKAVARNFGATYGNLPDERLKTATISSIKVESKLSSWQNFHGSAKRASRS